LVLRLERNPVLSSIDIANSKNFSIAGKTPTVGSAASPGT
jgi:hypothetical protein